VTAEVLIREAAESDADAIAAIYGHHVVHGTASFDLEPPPVEFHRKKIRWIVGAGWPFLVADHHGEVAGYAYVTQFRDRAAYRFTAEDSIYVHPDQGHVRVVPAVRRGPAGDRSHKHRTASGGASAAELAAGRDPAARRPPGTAGAGIDPVLHLAR
jgi:hypothetical protein